MRLEVLTFIFIKIFAKQESQHFSQVSWQFLATHFLLHFPFSFLLLHFFSDQMSKHSSDSSDSCDSCDSSDPSDSVVVVVGKVVVVVGCLTVVVVGGPTEVVGWAPLVVVVGGAELVVGGAAVGGQL